VLNVPSKAEQAAASKTKEIEGDKKNKINKKRSGIQRWVYKCRRGPVGMQCPTACGSH